MVKELIEKALILYQNTPDPLTTQHCWKYSNYYLFVPNQVPNTIFEFQSQLPSITEEIFDPLTITYPEKISLHNLINNPKKHSISINQNGLYNINQKFLGNYNITRTQIKINSNTNTEIIINSTDQILNSVTNNVIEIWVEPNSNVKILFDNSFKNSYIHNLIYLNIEDNSDVRLLFLTSNPKYEKTHIKSLINGQNSNFIVYILAQVEKSEHVDYRTENIHLKSYSKSLSVYRSVADGISQSTYTGLLRIEKEAKYCNAYQNSRNILLSQKAKIQTIPELEILNQEVSCTHGAVVSSIDKNSIYYFMSKGMEEKEAEKLLINGFLLDKIEENFSSNIYPLVYQKITNEEHIE